MLKNINAVGTDAVVMSHKWWQMAKKGSLGLFSHKTAVFLQTNTSTEIKQTNKKLGNC